MHPPRKTGPRGLRLGCLVLAITGAILIAALVVVALQQNRSSAPETRALETPSPIARIVVEALVAQAVLVPAPEGTPVRVEARFDPSRYELWEVPGEDEYRVGLRPAGSPSWALFRAKLGLSPPTMRIFVPRDMPVELEGRVDRGFLGLELGGLRVRSVDLDVKSGALKMTVSEPLAEPMEDLRVRGSRSSLDVSGLGHASPRSALLDQGLGAIDLDLRGRWSRDAVVRVETGVAGGTLWLPEGVTIVGIEGRLGDLDAETPRPTLTLELPARRGNLIVID